MYNQNSMPESRDDPSRWTLQGHQAAPHNNSFSSSSSSTMTLPQNIFTNPAIQPSTVINLSNSTDVVIGPMTQYQGPVSIYYMDASMQTAAGEFPGINSSNTSRSSSSNRQDNGSSGRAKSRRLTRNSLLLGVLVLLVLITAIVVLYVELHRSRGEPVSKEIYFGNSYEDGTFPNLGNGHLVIERNQWGASDNTQKLQVPLPHPAPYVLITHIGVQSQPCFNIYKCSIKMRTIQDSAIAEKNLPDIQSNFYVSDEGNIYVGRGWDWANTYANHTLAITFMGDYGRFTPTTKQLEGVQFLLAHAVANRKLEVDYKLVAQNQTKSTKSPGIYVYREIKKWPHFHPCNMEEAGKCGSELGMTAASWNGHQ
ncbi:peptidoglycan-recognition protein LA isoform X1 [Drosophila busckii]|uniref:peptidoglycan-recognition protein LA isoform X1 n=1 Tax=Drosophila busckii TaxID=30019 RepID=UPI001432CAAC|nr:peptidoglycan-recognition protein LA isoform X1 [Drosophila busckii]